MLIFPANFQLFSLCLRRIKIGHAQATKTEPPPSSLQRSYNVGLSPMQLGVIIRVGDNEHRALPISLTQRVAEC